MCSACWFQEQGGSATVRTRRAENQHLVSWTLHLPRREDASVPESEGEDVPDRDLRIAVFFTNTAPYADTRAGELDQHGTEMRGLW